MTTGDPETFLSTRAQTVTDVPDAAAVLRGLADPTRLRIYRLLRRGEACVCEVAAELGLAENLVSHHLGILRRLHLVIDRRDPADSRWVYYRINAQTLVALARELGELFDPHTLGTQTPQCGPMPVATPKRLSRSELAASRQHETGETGGLVGTQR